MSSQSLVECIEIDGRTYSVSELNEFGFISPLELSNGESKSNAVLVLDNKRLDVEFRVRRKVNGSSVCSFANLPLGTAEVLQKYLRDRSRTSSGNEVLEGRTYDELARGVVDDAPAQQASSGTDPGAKGRVKSFALIAILFAMIGLTVLAAVFMRSRSTLSVGNSALVGNSLAVNAKVEGEISEVLVGEGDVVKKGDVLIRLINPELSIENKQLAAQLNTAISKVTALEKQRSAFASKLKFASKKLELDREVAISELEAAKKARRSATAAFERLKPFVQSGAVTQLELDEVENQLLAEESICIAKENLVKQIDFSKEAADADVLIIGDRVDDALGRIDAALEIAKAEMEELKQLHELSLKREGELEIVAPRDGTVYVNYRQEGEFIKVADEVLGLSYPGKARAAGQVTAGQASRVLPGQPVTIRVPSLRLTIEGTVMAVGHRAMYSKGNYNADFRGATATDVPVKVYIADLPDDVPSGLRLDMAINTGFGIDWLDEKMGYKLNPIGSRTKKKSEMDGGNMTLAAAAADREATAKLDQPNAPNVISKN